MFYQVIAILYGYQMFTDIDDLYHYDLKANNNHIAYTFVTEKPKDFTDGEKQLKMWLSRLVP